MPGRIDETRPFLPVNIALLTVSDTRTEADDRSGNTLAELAAGSGRIAACRACTVQFADEVRMERSAAELAIGDGMQADRFLHRDHIPDAAVLQLVQCLGRELTVQRLLVSGAQLRRSQQAADVVGAKRSFQLHRAKQRPVPVSAGVR